jgi:membrane protease YdiL (CAAX protease family)
VDIVKHDMVILLVALAAVGFLFFPISMAGASVYYLSSAFLIAALAFASRRKGLKKALRYLFLSPKKDQLLSLVGLGGLALLSCAIVTGVVSVLLLQVGLLDGEPVAKKIVGLPLPILLLAFTLAPVAEEMLFRGFLFRKVSEAARSPIAGALVSTAIFAALHIAYGSIAEIAIAFSVGLVLCAYTQHTRSLVPAIVAHIAFNLLSIMFILGLI